MFRKGAQVQGTRQGLVIQKDRSDCPISRLCYTRSAEREDLPQRCAPSGTLPSQITLGCLDS